MLNILHWVTKNYTNYLDDCGCLNTTEISEEIICQYNIESSEEETVYEGVLYAQERLLARGLINL